MVDPLKHAFIETGGDLKAVALALIDLPEAWSAPLAKIRTPYELAIAQYRALGDALHGSTNSGRSRSRSTRCTRWPGNAPRRRAIPTTR